jgi:stalled ribosome rescue protein Dom34
MSYQHAVVWLDHLRAVVIDFSVDQEHVHLVASGTEDRQVHRKSGTIGSGKASEDREFFDEIVEAVGDAREILIVGPGQAKTHFKKDLDHRHPKVAELVVAVETADHPSVDQLLAQARKYFRKVDQLRGVAKLEP